MVTKTRNGGKHIRTKNTFKAGEAMEPVPTQVWGLLEPLYKVARDKVAKWGNELPSLVTPALAAKFEAAYQALEKATLEKDEQRVEMIAMGLLKGWQRLEDEAMAAGHKPLPPHAYCVEMNDERIVCFALHGMLELRKKHPDWVVYSFEDAACIVSQHFSKEFIETAFDAFPTAKVTRVLGGDKGAIAEELEDEIPW